MKDRIVLSAKIRLLSGFKEESGIKPWCNLPSGDIIELSSILVASYNSTNYIKIKMKINNGAATDVGSGQIAQYFRKIDWKYES